MYVEVAASCTIPPLPPIQGLGPADLNGNLIGDDKDDCAKLDLDAEDDLVAISSIEPAIRTTIPQPRSCDLGEATSDREDDLASLVNDTQVSEFDDTPPHAQRCMISLDPHHMHDQHVAFRNSGIKEDFANIHTFS